MAAVEAKGLTKSFGGVEVLKGVDLSVARGEIFGLVGPSGAGKSTLLRTLTGYFTPTEGTIEVLGGPPSAFADEERRRVGFMPQGFVLYDSLSVQQNLNFVAGLYDLGGAERRRRVREVLEFVELWEHRRKAARNISGGMQRRLQLAAAVVHEPELLFVDEPTASLDPILRRRFWKEFEQLREGGRTIFVTTQYVGEAEFCDRVGFLVDGRLAAVGTPEELRREAFGGEVLQLTLAGDPGDVGDALKAVEPAGHVVEVVQEGSAEEPVSRVRLVSPDADEALPAVMEALEGVEVRAVDLPTPSFDEVFFRLVRETERETDQNGREDETARP